MMKLIVLAISLILTTTAFAQGSSIQLHDLYEPSPVTFRFETPGWFILAGIILLITIILIIRQVRKYIKNRYRREALHKLEDLDNAVEMIPPLFVVLKQAAMHAFGRDKVGQLYGKEWLSFLEETGKDVRMTAYHKQITDAIYAGKEIKGDEQKAILLNAKNWVKTHAG
jgi:hypothetical protein